MSWEKKSGGSNDGGESKSGWQRKPQKNDSLVTGIGEETKRAESQAWNSQSQSQQTHQYWGAERRELRGNPDNPILMNELSWYMHLIVLWRTQYHSIYSSRGYIIQCVTFCWILCPLRLHTLHHLLTCTWKIHIYKCSFTSDSAALNFYKLVTRVGPCSHSTCRATQCWQSHMQWIFLLTEVGPTVLCFHGHNVESRKKTGNIDNQATLQVANVQREEITAVAFLQRREVEQRAALLWKAPSVNFSHAWNPLRLLILASSLDSEKHFIFRQTEQKYKATLFYLLWSASRHSKCL